MLSCYCPLSRLHMLFRLVPWKAIWANGSIEFVCFGLRYVVIVLSNAFLALAWLCLVSDFPSFHSTGYPLTANLTQSAACALNNLVRLIFRIPPSQPRSRAASPERVGNDRPGRRRTRRSAKHARTTTPRPPPTKSAVRSGPPAVIRHVSFTKENRESLHLSPSASAPPVRVKSIERLNLSISPVAEETERESSISSSTASPDSISPQATLEHESLSSRSVSPDLLATSESNKVHGICRRKSILLTPHIIKLTTKIKDIVHRRRTADEPKKPAAPPRRRTDPYQAPYFFPTPLSPGADDYVRIVRAERARLSISPAGSPSRKPSQLVAEPLSTLPSAYPATVPEEPAQSTLPEASSSAPKRPSASRRNANFTGVQTTTPVGSRETSPSPPRSRDRGKKHLHFFKGFSHSDKRSNPPSPLDNAAHSDDGASAGRIRKLSRRSSRLRRMLR